MADSNRKRSGEDERRLESGTTPPAPPQSNTSGIFNIHPAFYIVFWIAMSSGVILFNKWVLSAKHFDFLFNGSRIPKVEERQHERSHSLALFLTTWHMAFATAMTQLLARMTTTLDSRLKVPMDAPTYMRAIVPIGIMFSLSLIGGNMAYLYLSVSFIQMLKATNAVATLLATWAFGMAAPNMKVLLNVSAIVVGVVIASFGELRFHLLGFILQVGGIIAEALRLVMVQRLLSSAEFKMDPLVSVYYYAPACAAVNGVLTLIVEGPRMSMSDIYSLGLFTLIANASVAFLLNVSVVLLIGKTSAVVLTMSGVLKDILLVIASMVIFGDPVTGQQYFGYSIALGGLVYYRLGREGVQAAVTNAQLTLSEFRHSQSGRLKITIVGLAFTAALVFLLHRNWQSTPVTGINTSTV